MTYKLYKDSDGDAQLEITVGNYIVFSATVNQVEEAHRELHAKLLNACFIEASEHFYNKGRDDLRKEVRGVLGLE
jgi:alpha/beta superfamily hydrolase